MGNGAWIDWGESYYLGIYNDLEYLQEAFIQLCLYNQIYHIHVEIHVFQVCITATHTCACTLTHALITHVLSYKCIHKMYRHAMYICGHIYAHTLIYTFK